MSTPTSVDPVTFEIIRHKLYGITEEAIIALENVSGSPVTNEGHDMMVSLYKADGSLMVGGVGFLHHLTSAAQAVKHVVENFSEDPGIFPDDVYFFNDSYTAALHPPDVYIISPIHFNGELTGFVANFVHVTDIGAVDPGGFSPNARDNYHEGFQTKGLKIVERGKLRRDVVETFLNIVRDPGMTNLDLKSQLAANHVAKERMKKLYAEYGVDTVSAIADGLIVQSENLMRQRLRELPNGRWQARQYVDLPSGEILTVQLTAIKEDDTLTYDFTGTSAQSELGVNCCYWATWGGMFAPIFPLLAWDLVWNEGVSRPFRLIAPEGTCVNCIRPAPISIATVGIIQVVNNLSVQVLAKMMGASETYQDRATGVWSGSHAVNQLYGLNSEGQFFISMLTDTFAGSGGARSFKDGVDIGGEIPNVVSRWANVETQELHTPLLYKYRRAVPDSGGPGKYRGGLCHEYAFTPHEIGGPEMTNVLFGKGVISPMSVGIFGGYPGCNVGYRVEEATGEVATRPQWGDVPIAPGQLFYTRFMGGGGYGDPIDREPEAVLNDVLLGAVSSGAAQDIYGVVIEGHGVDQAATAARRQEIRRQRLGQEPRRAVSPVVRTHRRLGEYVQVNDGHFQCVNCGEHLAGSSELWKDIVPRRRQSTGVAGANRDGAGRIFLQEYYCGGCGTQLDVDVVSGDDPPLHDLVADWPEPVAR